jgi:hypothetical protein
MIDDIEDDDIEYARIFYPKINVTDYATIVKVKDNKMIRVLKDPTVHLALTTGWDARFYVDGKVLNNNLEEMSNINVEIIDKVEFMLING